MRSTATFMLVAAAVGALSFAGCGKEDRTPPAPAPPAAATNDGPDWLNDPTQDGKHPIAAYGVADYKLGGENAQRNSAMASARDEIARAIAVKVQAVFKSWTREGGEITSQDSKTMAMQMEENISRQVTNQLVQATSQRARWIDPGTKRMYVWTYPDQAAIEAAAAATKAAVRAEAEKRAHFAAKIEADKAFADLDKLIDKEMGVAPAK
jgi:hypothetical protein